MIGLFLDDVRFPSDVSWMKYPENVRWEIARTVNDFVDRLLISHYDVISFDHDLMDFDSFGNELSGFTAVKEMVDMHMKGRISSLPKMTFFHSMNPVGRENMKGYLDSYCKSLEW